MKKTLLALSISAGLVLAPVLVLAQTNEVIEVNGAVLGTSAAANTFTIALSQDAEKMKGFLEELEAGSLTSAEQKEMHTLMTQPPKMMNLSSGTAGNFAYKMSDGKQVMLKKHFDGNQGAWLGLMGILTVAMIWTVLLLLIAVLWHHLKKHKH